jgi:hypothetical protein
VEYLEQNTARDKIRLFPSLPNGLKLSVRIGMEGSMDVVTWFTYGCAMDEM